jgi:RNA polymerase sigma-70 factor (ECF subfamily)
MADESVFIEHRALLFGIAYRVLGSVTEAEDVVQDAFVKWQRVVDGRVKSPRAYLSATVTRLAIDALRSARVKREVYVGPWLPEPLLTTDDIGADMELADSLSTAFLVVLERLTPAERAAFVLREVFDYPYGEIAEILEKSEAACRQLVHRAKAAVAAQRPRFSASPQQQALLTQRFVQACGGGDLAALLDVLTDDVVVISDGGDQARAAKRPVSGRDKVARFLLGILGNAPDDMTVELQPVNATPGILLRAGGHPFAVITLDCRPDAIAGVHIVANPDKLAHVT